MGVGFRSFFRDNEIMFDIPESPNIKVKLGSPSLVVSEEQMVIDFHWIVIGW